MESIRLDKWLWQARFFKSRARASELCTAGRVRVDGAVVAKAHHAIRPGAVLTFPQAREVRVVRVVAVGTRRGPAAEARTLYEDLAPPAPRPPAVESPALRPPGTGRPTKAERRAVERLLGEE